MVLLPSQGGFSTGNGTNITESSADDVVAMSPLDYTEAQRRGATAYITLNATAYQVEFFPLQDNVEFSSDDCRYLGCGDINNSSTSPTPVKLCLKSIGEDLAIGIFDQVVFVLTL